MRALFLSVGSAGSLGVAGSLGLAGNLGFDDGLRAAGASGAASPSLEMASAAAGLAASSARLAMRPTERVSWPSDVVGSLTANAAVAMDAST